MDLLEILNNKEARIDLFEKDSEEENILGRLRYTFVVGDSKNANKRTYGSDLLQQEILRFGERLKETNVAGQLEHPSAGSHTELSKVSHLVTDVSFDSETKRGTAESAILNTSKGKDLMVLLKNDVPLGASVRGRGTVDSLGQVQGDYELLSIDLVSAPSFGPDTMISKANLIESGNGVFEAKVLTEEQQESLFEFDCRSGFKGSKEDWLKSLTGSADNSIAERRYEEARKAGFKGSFSTYKKEVLKG